MADMNLSIPLEKVKNVYWNVAPYTFPIELVVIDMPHDPLCPISLEEHFKPCKY
jgi:hypothetical protein